jgi:hypothetical protein
MVYYCLFVILIVVAAAMWTALAIEQERQDRESAPQNNEK